MRPPRQPPARGRARRSTYEGADPGQVLERLSQRLDLLRGGRDADPRQQTLRATIEWSRELLSAEERRLFTRLSIFAGGCTLDAAEEVCDADLETLQSLVEKSLLRFSGGRYWMLETIREYAAERLDETGERAELGKRHAEFFTRVIEAQPRMRKADLVVELAGDEGNFRAALAFAGGGRDPDLALRLAGALWRFWWIRDQDEEARMWLEEANVNGESGPAPLRAEVLRGLGVVVDGLGDPARGQELEEEALGLYREIGDREGIAACLIIWAGSPSNKVTWNGRSRSSRTRSNASSSSTQTCRSRLAATSQKRLFAGVSSLKLGASSKRS